MKDTKEVFVDGEVLNLKNGMFGYRIVHPTKDKDDNIIWINFLLGGWENFIKLLFILLVLGLFLMGYSEITKSCNDLAADPCKYTNLDCSLRGAEGNLNDFIGYLGGDVELGDINEEED